MQHRLGIAHFKATIYLHNNVVFGAEQTISPVTYRNSVICAGLFWQYAQS
jgi:hypothetical protein